MSDDMLKTAVYLGLDVSVQNEILVELAAILQERVQLQLLISNHLISLEATWNQSLSRSFPMLLLKLLRNCPSIV